MATKDEAIQAALHSRGKIQVMANDLRVSWQTAKNYYLRWVEVKEIVEAQKTKGKHKKKVTSHE